MVNKRIFAAAVMTCILCASAFSTDVYAAGGQSQTVTLTAEVPEKPDSQMQIPNGSKAESLKDVKLPDGWRWKEENTALVHGGYITATAIYEEGSAEMEIRVGCGCEIVASKTDETYIIGKDNKAVIYCTGELKELQSVSMDGKITDAANYGLTDGSTILTFKKSYLDTLSVGKHTVTLNYTATSIETTLTVSKAGTPAGDSSGGNGSQDTTGGAKTGDDTNTAEWLYLLLGAGGVIMFMLRKKKNA